MPSILRELHIVALSGGKDSTAMALRLKEIAPRDYVYVCTPTGDELPEMYDHWKKLSEVLGSRIVPVVGGTLNGMIDKYNALPNWRQRWCTTGLKIKPFAAWLMKQAVNYDKVISYVGLRADEEERVGGDYTKIPNVEMRFPLREWGWQLKDVYSYLEDKGIEIPRRTDCARCFYQTLGEWWELWKLHPEIYADAEAQEARIGHTFRSPGRDTWPAGLAQLRLEFESGRIPRGVEMQPDLFGKMKCRVCIL